ncbi:hypothetical protein ACFOHP_33910 [Couchioplanes caeruleus subsp. azureus]|uniref:hypothetical protein n=1 Tax=Couchioplanes caeruleus TaxID=56438 RepID=UPI003613E54E
MSRRLSGRLDDIDTQIGRIERLIESACRTDFDMAAGLATTEPMPNIQRKIDQFAATVEAVERELNKMGAAV